MTSMQVCVLVQSRAARTLFSCWLRRRLIDTQSCFIVIIDVGIVPATSHLQACAYWCSAAT